jgi:hypothetical protein
MVAVLSVLADLSPASISGRRPVMISRGEALAAGAGAAAVWLGFYALARRAVRRQIVAAVNELDVHLDRDRDTAIETLPTQARARIDAEIKRALSSAGLTLDQARILSSGVRAVYPAARTIQQVIR